LVNQGVQEFHLTVPAHWKNVEFTGLNIRSREQQSNAWTIHLQEKAWNGYTLVVTYDYQFDATNAVINAAGLHTPEAEHETGSVAITTAASVKVAADPVSEPLRLIDQTELAESDRALITRSVLKAYHYTGHEYQLKLNVTRQPEAAVLDAVVDRTQLTSALTDSGEMLTQASFMVKNNGKQFQGFQLPAGANFWGCYVDGQSSKAETNQSWLLVPLPQRANRDEAFAVDIVYAQGVGAVKDLWFPRNVALEAPKTDLPNTFAEWEVYPPADSHLSSFAGSMTVARDTAYGLREAWRKFCGFYGDLFSEYGMIIGIIGVTLLVVILVAVRMRQRSWAGAITVLLVFVAAGIVVLMTIPNFIRARTEYLGSTLMDSVGPSAAPHVKALQFAISADRSASRDAEEADKDITVNPAGRGGGGGRGGRGAGGAGGGFGNAPAAATMPQNGLAIRQAASIPSEAPPPPPASPVAQPGFAPPTRLAQRAQQGAPAGPGASEEQAQALARGLVAANTAPTAAGLRSIHIEIPKNGQPFTFTKVLNTGGKPLDIRMSVMNAHVFNVMRSGVQVAAFLLGLLLIWGQRRNRGSFVITVGTALALCAVAELLITGRVLHLALIAAVPVLVLLILIAVLRRIWPRKMAVTEKQKAESRNGTEPPIVPPVVASIALLLLIAHSAMAQDPETWMNFDNAFSLPTNSAGARAASAARIGVLQSAIPNPQSAITSASYTGVIGEKVAQFDGAIVLTSVSTNQSLQLFGSEVALQDFSVKSGEARLLRVGDRVGVLLPHPGEASIAVKFVVKLGGDVSKRQLNFAIPPALSSTFNASIDEADAEVEFPTAVAFERTQADKQTRIAATIGPEDRVEILWTPRTKKANEVAATIFVENDSLVTLANGVLDVRTTLDYQISQGELRQARVLLPAGHRLLRVEGDSIRTWQLQPQVGADRPESGADILTVDLLKGVSPTYKLSIETEKILDTFPVTAAVAIPHALDVKRETGLVAGRSGEELSLSVDRAVDVTRVDASEFPRGDGTGTLFSVWRFLNPDFSLALKAETVQPQVEAVVHNNVRISPSQVTLSATIDYTVKRAGVFALQIALPAGYTLDPVTGVTGNNILQWHPRDAAAGAGQILDVSFKNRLLGAYSLRLELARPHTALPPTVSIPGVQPLEVQKLSGFVTVAAEPGVAAKTTNFDGLTEIPGASLGSGANGAAGVLAYKFLSATPGPLPDWKLDVACEKIDPWVRVEIAQITSVSDNLLNGLAIVHYDIQNARVKEFRFKIPAVYTNIEFNCPNLRRRDQNTTNGEWTVEVQDTVFGPFQFQITWEKPVDLKTNTLDLPPIQALGVERESGFVVVSGKKALQVAEQAASGELVKIDAGELPDWAGGVQGQALTWRYIRPGYSLSVRAERFADAAVLQALAEQVNLTSVVADDGQSMTQLRLLVRNNGLQDLEVQLPANATVWSAFVGGEAVRPAKSSQGKLLLPLEASDAAADAPVAVELTYIVPEKFPSGRGDVNLISPSLNVPLKNARWDVYLPPDYDYQKFTGSMIHEAQAAPTVQTYSLSEYRAQEAGKKQAKQAETTSFISNARKNLAISNIKGIDQNWLNGNGAYIESLDTDTRNQIEQVKQELNYQNSANLIIGYNNPGQIAPITQSLNDSQFRQAQMPAQSDVQRNALLQWDKLARAQQLAVARVQPLRVNLPTRGVHYAFTQILQTEVQKPLTIQFTAANTRTGGLIGRLAGGVLGLAVLWILVQILLSRLSRDRQTA
jgi:hypothetical protein